VGISCYAVEGMSVERGFWIEEGFLGMVWVRCGGRGVWNQSEKGEEERFGAIYFFYLWTSSFHRANRLFLMLDLPIGYFEHRLLRSEYPQRVPELLPEH
jgi:hypothetical protein